ncbi:MAG: hypothetical protein KDA24_03815 [Deltaproteobacteria bacterium]|nr:hypothetical protein [Deltaproteobacteria bacterium]
MRRIGILVAILSVLLLAGLGMLVARALESVERERAMRHEVLAERVFDELEEQLTELTEREEARPFLQYRFFYVPEGQVGANPALSRSPLSNVPEDDWLLGWFQLDPGGGVTTPLEPDDDGLASSIGWARDLALETRIARLREVARTLPVQAEDRRLVAGADIVIDEKTAEPPKERSLSTKTPAPTSEPAPAPPPPPSKPATTIDKTTEDGLADARTETGRKSGLRVAKKESAPAPQQSADPYGIGSLNKGATRRADRQQRVTKSNVENVRSYQFPEGNEAILRGDQGLPEVAFDAESGDAVVQVADEAAKDQWTVADGAAFAEEEEAAEREDSGGFADLDELDEAVDDAADESREATVDSVQSEVAYAPEKKRKAKQARRRNRAVPPPAIGARAKRQAAQGPQAASPEPEPAAEPVADAPTLDAPAPEVTEQLPDQDDDGLDELRVQEAQPQDRLGAAATGEASALSVGAEAGGVAYRATGGLVDNASVAGKADADPNSQREAQKAQQQNQPRRAPTSRSTSTAVVAPPIEDAGDREVDVEISPFRGHRVDDDTMVLFRTVRIGEVVYVQGLALLLPKLVRWLEEEALAGSEVESLLQLAWNGGAPASLRAAPDFTFAHTFADPFAGLSVTSYLTALPEQRGSGRTWILQLTALLVIVGLLGIIALWRMVSVVVHFAERRSNFVAAVSHELKTPLTAIRMYAEMLRDGYVLNEEKRSEYYETMAAESERLSRLIQNVLELSRLEKGASAGSEIITGDVRPVLEEAVRVLERHARERGFSIVLHLPDDLPAVRYERDGLLQVLINLVDNGIKFSKASGAKEVEIEAIPKGGGVVLQIRDHGPGVPTRQLNRIFQPFYRGERELTRRTKGTGIGLALVKGIVDRMGGNVSARNHPDGGFEVRVSLSAAA